MSNANSWLIDHTGNEPVDDEIVRMFPSFKGLQWATYSWEHLSLLMRQVLNKKDEREKKTDIALRDIRNSLSDKVIGERIKELLS
jgi:hypothetical protein